jgi:hypothetical protein
VDISKYQMSMWDNQLSRPHAYLLSEAKRSLGTMIRVEASFPFSPLHEQLESRVMGSPTAQDGSADGMGQSLRQSQDLLTCPIYCREARNPRASHGARFRDDRGVQDHASVTTPMSLMMCMSAAQELPALPRLLRSIVAMHNHGTQGCHLV